MVRCKFRCVEKKDQIGWSGVPVITTVSFCPVTAKEGEDSIFGKATPIGQIVLGIQNPEAAAFFELGKSYYFDAVMAQDELPKA